LSRGGNLTPSSWRLPRWLPFPCLKSWLTSLTPVAVTADATHWSPFWRSPCWPCYAAARVPPLSLSLVGTTASDWPTPWDSGGARPPRHPVSPIFTACWMPMLLRRPSRAGSPHAYRRRRRTLRRGRSRSTVRRCGAVATVRRLVTISFPPTLMSIRRFSPRSALTPRPTSIKPRWNCWASCRSEAMLFWAMPCSANATCARRSSSKGAITCSWSRVTSKAWKET
jgi:hypothetical protein